MKHIQKVIIAELVLPILPRVSGRMGNKRVDL